MRLKKSNVVKLEISLHLIVISGVVAIGQWIMFSIFEGNLKTARPMRKLENRFGNDFLQSVQVIGLGFEGLGEFFGMRLGRGSFETRETYTTISLKSLSNFKNPTDGFEIETVITTLEFNSFNYFFIKDIRVKKGELVVIFNNLIWSLLLFFPSYRAVQLENILALKFWFSPLEVYLSISISIIILVCFNWPKLVTLIYGL